MEWKIRPITDDATVVWQAKRIVELETMLAELQEAIAWERECENTVLKMCEYNSTKTWLNAKISIEDIIVCARAAVDKLVVEG